MVLLSRVAVHLVLMCAVETPSSAVGVLNQQSYNWDLLFRDLLGGLQHLLALREHQGLEQTAVDRKDAASAVSAVLVVQEYHALNVLLDLAEEKAHVLVHLQKRFHEQNAILGLRETNPYGRSFQIQMI